MKKNLDQKLEFIEVQSLPNFQKNMDEALNQLKKRTGYTGDFNNIEQRDSYFSSYEIQPIPIEGRIIGVKIEYSLNETRESVFEPRKRATGGSGPASPLYNL